MRSDFGRHWWEEVFDPGTGKTVFRCSWCGMVAEAPLAEDNDFCAVASLMEVDFHGTLESGSIWKPSTSITVLS